MLDAPLLGTGLACIGADIDIGLPVTDEAIDDAPFLREMRRQ